MDARAYTPFCAPHASPRRPNVTTIKKRGGTAPAYASGSVAKGEEGDATPNLFLKHPNTTLATYVMKHAFKTLAKTPKNT
jgi:hypothetical protein